MSRLTAPFLGIVVVVVAGADVDEAVVVVLLDEVEAHPARPTVAIQSVIPATRRRGFI
jgi:hypothetical protein